MTIDLRALEHFVGVAESGGFAAAARKLNTSQPGLSRSIAQLESSLGAKLFERTTRGTMVTEEGRRLLPHALSILSEVGRAQSLFETGPSDTAEQLVIGVSPSLLYRGLPEALEEITARPDKLNVIVRSGTIEELLDQVRRREMTIAVCFVPNYMSGRRSDHADVVFEELTEETMFPVARADHPIFTSIGGEPTLPALSAHDWVIPHQMSVSYRFESAFFRRNLPIPIQRLNCSSMFLLKRAILDWSLIGIVPHFLVDDEIAAGTLRPLELPELQFPYALSVITARSATLSPGATMVLEVLRRQFTGDHAPAR
jgi:LysR family transcriptional regulator of gallate degradation